MPNDRFVGKLPTTQPPNEHDARVVASATSALHGIAATRACLNCDNGFRRRGDDLVPCETCNAKARPMSQEAMAREHRQRSVAPVIPVGSEAARIVERICGIAAVVDEPAATAVAKVAAVIAHEFGVDPLVGDCQGSGQERVIPATDKHAVQRDVEDFHRVVVGIPDGDTPAIRRPQLRAELIREEAEETVWAIENGDLIGAIDGMCDLLCVVYGTAAEWGINLAPFWDEVHRTNMAKAGGPVREDGKRLKPEGWVPPDLRRVLDVYTAKTPSGRLER